MNTDIDWRSELDGSFGTGHDLPPGHYVAAGRSAVRRRRAASVALVAAMVVGVGAAWASGPGGTPRGDAPVATQGPSPEQARDRDRDRDTTERDRSRDRQPQAQPSMTVQEEFIGNPATIDTDGSLKLSPLTDEVLERVPNPMGYRPGEGRSWGLRVIYQGVEKYSLVAGAADGSSISLSTNTATGDFASWLEDKVSVQRSLDGPSRGSSSPPSIVDTPEDWLTLGADGTLESASPFVAVMRVRDDVDLGEGFARETDRAGVARLQVAGSTEMVAWRVVAGRLEVVRGPGRFASLAAFVDWARRQYDSGVGLR